MHSTRAHAKYIYISYTNILNTPRIESHRSDRRGRGARGRQDDDEETIGQGNEKIRTPEAVESLLLLFKVISGVVKDKSL